MSCSIIFCVLWILSAPSMTMSYPINMITKGSQTAPWLEAGFTYISDQEWTSVSPTSTFTSAVIFISLPEISGTGYPVVPRLRNVVNSGSVSFEAKFYQVNDSFCDKTWFTPQPMSALQIEWLVVEKGAYNVTDHYFFIGTGLINRPVSDSADNSNFIRIDYPTGCVTATDSCRFRELGDVAGIQQLQTLVYDRFLSVRGVAVRLSFTRFILVPHDSTTASYYVMSSFETLGYMMYEKNVNIDCVENLVINTAVFPSVTSQSVVMTYTQTFLYAPGVFGFISTPASLGDATTLRVFDRTASNAKVILQEDQCVDEETAHTNAEQVDVIVIGELSVAGQTTCAAVFTSALAPTLAPTLKPTVSPTSKPTAIPSFAPTSSPTSKPTSAPTPAPTFQPTTSPTSVPTSVPTVPPTFAPSVPPTSHPTFSPTASPTAAPTILPTVKPTSTPTTSPTSLPTTNPTFSPTPSPTHIPSQVPTCSPTLLPTTKPTEFVGTPSASPTLIPTEAPSCKPSSQPTFSPTKIPTSIPTSTPTNVPTSVPTAVPTIVPSAEPTTSPSSIPTGEPTAMPTSLPTATPSGTPTSIPSLSPTSIPTCTPSNTPSLIPTSVPTSSPSASPSSAPSSHPSAIPTSIPTSSPSTVPSAAPSSHPSSIPTSKPTSSPSGWPSSVPTGIPTVVPTSCPSHAPTDKPTFAPSAFPTCFPSLNPTSKPSSLPTSYPTALPSVTPSAAPTSAPTNIPTANPTVMPSTNPTGQPTSIPTTVPTAIPTEIPTTTPTGTPSSIPSPIPSSTPSSIPTFFPSSIPTALPSSCPTALPTYSPSAVPSSSPSAYPSSAPSNSPTESPSVRPTLSPTDSPTCSPSNIPTAHPTTIPSTLPSSTPSAKPTSSPSTLPSSIPSSIPTSVPSSSPTMLPTLLPTALPTALPTCSPSQFPTDSATLSPSSTSPTCMPTVHPSAVPTSSPTDLPSVSPSIHPTCAPTQIPSVEPTIAPTSEPTPAPSSLPSPVPSLSPTVAPTVKPTLQPTASPTQFPLRQLPTYFPTHVPTTLPTRSPAMVNPTTVPTSLPTVYLDPLCYELGKTYWPNTTYWAGGYESWNGAKTTHTCQSMQVYQDGGYDLDLMVVLNLQFSTQHVNAYPVDFMIGIWNPLHEGLQVGGYDVFFDASWPLVPRSTVESNQTKWLDPRFFTYSTDVLISAKINTTILSTQPAGNWTVCVSNGYRDQSVYANYEANIAVYSCPHAPTEAPTISPTTLFYRYYKYPFYTLFDRITALLNGLFDATYLEVIWYGDYINGTREDLDWNRFIRKIQDLDQYSVPTDIHVLELGANCTDCPFPHVGEFRLEHLCSTRAAVVQLWDAIKNEEDATLSCNNSMWYVRKCEIGIRVCVDCNDPCVSHKDSSNIAVPSKSAWLPIGGHAAGLSFKVELKEKLWPEWDMNCTEGNNEINVTVLLHGAGYLYCTAFKDTDLPIQSVLAISKDGVQKSNYAADDLRFEMTIAPLRERTKYTVMCFSESFIRYPGIESRSPLSESLANACTRTTLGVKRVNLAAPNGDNILRPNITSSALVVSLDLAPDSQLNVTFAAYYAPFNENSQCTFEKDNTVVIRDVVSPTKATFMPNDIVLRREAYFSATLEGCYFLTAYVTGDDTVGYTLFAAQSLPYNLLTNSSNITHGIVLQVVGNTLQIPRPSIIDIRLSADGSQMIATYSTNTDRGEDFELYEKSFRCDVLFSFVSANASWCKFSTPTIILATYPSGSQYSLPSVNDTIYILGGKVRAYCTSTEIGECKSYPYELPTTRLLQPCVAPITSPVIVLNAPSQLNSNSDLVLDILGSSGNGARKWVSITWEVLFPNKTSYVTGTNYLNNGSLKWFGCVPASSDCNLVPRSLFGTGVYTFIVTMVNFLNVQRSSSVSVKMVDDATVPVVYLLGPQRRYITNNNTLSLSAKVVSTSAVSYKWLVFEEDTIIYTIANQAQRDPRRFVTAPYALSPGKMYKFEILVTSATGQVVSADTQVFVSRGSIVAVISGATKRSISQLSALVLNATLSYDTETPSTEHLSYQWTCTMVYPLSSSGCDAFNNAEKPFRFNSTITIASIASILAPGEYLFSVAVFAPDARYASSETSITILPGAVTYPSIEVVNVPLIIDSTRSNALKAVIKYDSPYEVEWRISSTNRTLHRRNFIGGGLNIDGYQFSPIEIEGDVQYIFQVRVSPYNCNNCGVSSSRIVVMFNFPPHSGDFLVTPSSGSDITLFTLFASNWQDTELPLKYSYALYSVEDDMYYTIRSPMEITYLKTLLPAAYARVGNMHSLRLTIMDMYDSTFTVTRNVHVNSSSHNVTTSIRDIQANLQTVVEMENANDMLLILLSRLVALWNHEDSSCFELSDPSVECAAVSSLVLEVVDNVLIYSDIDIGVLSTLANALKLVLPTHMIASLNVDHVVGITASISEILAEINLRDIYVANEMVGYLSTVSSIAQVLAELPSNRRSLSDNALDSVYFRQLVSVGRNIYSILELGQIIEQPYNPTALYHMKVERGWPSLQSAKDKTWPVSDIDLFRTLHREVRDQSPWFGYLLISVSRQYSSCVLSYYDCKQGTPEVYVELSMSSQADISSLNGLVYHLPLILPEDRSDPFPTRNRTIVYRECGNDENTIEYTCPTNITFGEPHTFTGLNCAFDSSRAWELACPVYNYYPVLASDFLEDSNGNCSRVSVVATECKSSVSYQLVKSEELLGVGPAVSVYTLKTTTSSLFVTKMSSPSNAFSFTQLFPTMSPTLETGAKSDSARTFVYKEFPAFYTLLALLVVLFFILIALMILGSRQPRKLRAETSTNFAVVSL